jgi:hypothetical protein
LQVFGSEKIPKHQIKKRLSLKGLLINGILKKEMYNRISMPKMDDRHPKKEAGQSKICINT